MTAKRNIEVFSAGCPACRETVELVQRLACPSCDVQMLDMNDPAVAARGKTLGVRSVPAIAVDGRLLKPRPGDCCVFCSYGDLPCPSRQREGA